MKLVARLAASAAVLGHLAVAAAMDSARDDESLFSKLRAAANRAAKKATAFMPATAASLFPPRSPTTATPGVATTHLLSATDINSSYYDADAGFQAFLRRFSREYAELVDVCQLKITDTCKEGEKQQAFVAKTGKEAEFDAKKQVFFENVQVAQKRNKKNNVHGVTKFMDYTDAEFKKLLGLRLTERDWQHAESKPRWAAPFKHSKRREDNGNKAPKTGKRDWRKEGVITPIKDQGHCGSCWSFATTETIESAALVQGYADKASPFIGAPQESVSCDQGGMSPDHGCNGGSPMSALDYYKTHGLEQEKDFPYTSGSTGQDGQCKYDSSLGKYNVVEDHMVALWGLGEDDMVAHVLHNGPLSIAVYAMPWKTYTGGIMTADDCGTDDVDHAVQAVAVDEEENSWTIRNSWNTNWGEDGYIRLELNANTCSLASMAIRATVKPAEDGGVDAGAAKKEEVDVFV